MRSLRPPRRIVNSDNSPQGLFAAVHESGALLALPLLNGGMMAIIAQTKLGEVKSGWELFVGGSPAEEKVAQTESRSEAWFQPGNPSEALPFEAVVESYYGPLFKFALSLTHSEADACDLTQHTFYTWSTKGSQLRDAAKVKTWLFTILHRAFLQTKRRQARFPHYQLEEVDTELPCIAAEEASRLDSAEVLDALAKIDESFRAPVALFYLEDCPYKEIAAILDIPLGTVKSRIARGITQLKKALSVDPCYGRHMAA